jgi:hypothetical protein
MPIIDAGSRQTTNFVAMKSSTLTSRYYSAGFPLTEVR